MPADTSDFPDITPTDAGFDPEALDDAIRFAQANDTLLGRDIGATILRDGQKVTEWGDIHRVDMTFSISKSYLALLAGIAVDDGLIRDIDAPVRDLIDIDELNVPQNRSITWAHLLHLSSEWQGTLWDKPDWIDHYRDLTESGTRPPIGTKRPLEAPGTFWEYNDVRVNLLALALLHVFRRPLPDVLKERIMDPVGASETWEWHGYDNSYVTIDGQRMQSVSGGAHWGGGLWISAMDHARVGQLMLQGGMWSGKRLLSQDWVNYCRTPCALNPQYGALWWLNTDQSYFPAAPSSSFIGLGVGAQILWINPDHDMVAVLRWMAKDAVTPLVAKIMQALNP